jgi:D-3-phosphoglycerate dehydrogenase
VLGYDPKAPTQDADLLGIELVGLAELFTRSDYVSLHLPENDNTRRMINRDLLGLMKTGATLINCARAGVVNEDDLREFKAKKNLRFLNDVYPKDAEGPKSVADMADIMAPHLGANTIEANRKAAELAAHQLIALDTKGTHPAVVNKA